MAKGKDSKPPVESQAPNPPAASSARSGRVEASEYDDFGNDQPAVVANATHEDVRVNADLPDAPVLQPAGVPLDQERIEPITATIRDRVPVAAQPTAVVEKTAVIENAGNIDPNRQITEAEVDANRSVEAVKGDISPMQTTQSEADDEADDEEPAEKTGRRFTIAVGKLGAFSYGTLVYESEFPAGTKIKNLLRKGYISETLAK